MHACRVGETEIKEDTFFVAPALHCGGTGLIPREVHPREGVVEDDIIIIHENIETDGGGGDEASPARSGEK